MEGTINPSLYMAKLKTLDEVFAIVIKKKYFLTLICLSPGEKGNWMASLGRNNGERVVYYSSNPAQAILEAIKSREVIDKNE